MLTSDIGNTLSRNIVECNTTNSILILSILILHAVDRSEISIFKSNHEELGDHGERYILHSPYLQDRIADLLFTQEGGPEHMTSIIKVYES